MTPNPTLEDRVHDQFVLAVPPEWLDPVEQAARCVGSTSVVQPTVWVLETPETAVAGLGKAIGLSPRHLIPRHLIPRHLIPRHLIIVDELSADVRRPAYLAEYRSRIGRLAVDNAPEIRVNAVLVRLSDIRAGSGAPRRPSVAEARVVLSLGRALTEIRSATGQTLRFDAGDLTRTD